MQNLPLFLLIGAGAGVALFILWLIGSMIVERLILVSRRKRDARAEAAVQLPNAVAAPKKAKAEPKVKAAKEKPARAFPPAKPVSEPKPKKSEAEKPAPRRDVRRFPKPATELELTQPLDIKDMPIPPVELLPEEEPVVTPVPAEAAEQPSFEAILHGHNESQPVEARDNAMPVNIKAEVPAEAAPEPETAEVTPAAVEEPEPVIEEAPDVEMPTESAESQAEPEPVSQAEPEIAEPVKSKPTRPVRPDRIKPVKAVKQAPEAPRVAPASPAQTPSTDFDSPMSSILNQLNRKG
jgi:hypothetical protein